LQFKGVKSHVNGVAVLTNAEGKSVSSTQSSIVVGHFRQLAAY